MGMYAALGISASGLAAERLRMDVIANNLANADSTNGVGDAYHRRAVVMAESSGSGAQFSLPRPAGLSATGDGSADLNGVAVTGIVEDPTPGKQVYDPGHPDANAQGYVTMPNVDSVTEMVDLISESRAYEANTTAMQTAKQMFSKTLELLK